MVPYFPFCIYWFVAGVETILKRLEGFTRKKTSLSILNMLLIIIVSNQILQSFFLHHYDPYRHSRMDLKSLHQFISVNSSAENLIISPLHYMTHFQAQRPTLSYEQWKSFPQKKQKKSIWVIQNIKEDIVLETGNFQEMETAVIGKWSAHRLIQVE